MRGEPAIEVPTERIRAFCRRWNIIQFSLFGSVLRDDFGPESDLGCGTKPHRPVDYTA